MSNFGISLPTVKKQNCLWTIWENSDKPLVPSMEKRGGFVCTSPIQMYK